MYIKIFFPSLSRGTVCLLADREQCLESARSTILEPLEFTVYVTRNISAPSMHFPNVDVQLGLGDVEFHLHTEDVTALLTIGLAATRISEIMAPPTKPKGEITFRQQSLVSARADFVLFWSSYPCSCSEITTKRYQCL